MEDLCVFNLYHTLHPVVTSGGYSRVYHNEIVNGQI